MNKKRMHYLGPVFVILLISLFCSPAYSENKIKEGMELPDLTLEGSDCHDKNDYLGVENLERYMEMSEIPAKLMVIEFFSVHCPICQKQAPVANKLYNILHRNPKLKNDVKMFAIGIGNRQNEIDAYKQQHHVKFPLFIDPYSKLHKQHGMSQIPYTIIINKSRHVLYTHIGIIEDMDKFMGKILEFHEKE